jgi:hypothetical protein
MNIQDNAFSNCTKLTIFCEALSAPKNWGEYWSYVSWDYGNCPVYWGYAGEKFTYTFETGSENSIEPITSSLSITLPVPTRDTYYFMGWYDNSEFSGEPLGDVYYSLDKHILYAKWISEDEYFDGSSFKMAYPIKVGETLPVNIDTAGKNVYFKFTATEARTYTFQASDGGVDSYGYLYNANESQISSDDDGAGNRHFKMSRALAAGETVYIKAKLYSSRNTGTYNLTVL